MSTNPELPNVYDVPAIREPLMQTYDKDYKDDFVKNKNLCASPDASLELKWSFLEFGQKLKSIFKDNQLESNHIPRPDFSEDFCFLNETKGDLMKIPSYVIYGILKRFPTRFIHLKKRQFKAYFDSKMTVLREDLNLNHLTSIQITTNHEDKTEAASPIYCFEISLAIPKNRSSDTTNALFDSKGFLLSTQKVTYAYGSHSKGEK